jgi:hypothetical protein
MSSSLIASCWKLYRGSHFPGTKNDLDSCKKSAFAVVETGIGSDLGTVDGKKKGKEVVFIPRCLL